MDLGESENVTHFIRCSLAAWLAVIVMAFANPTLAATEAAIGVRHLTFIDLTRPIKASSGFAGAPVRRLDVTVWYPADSASGENVAPAAGAPRPLVLYSHGSYGRADNAMHLVNMLVKAGYIVAAPDYPLSSRAAYTKITGSDATDVSSQTRDVHFVIDSLLANKDLSPLIDSTRIATMGHSLGAVTSYFTSFGANVRDPRIKAVVLLGAGDPVQAALSFNMGLVGTMHAAVHVPVLFLTAEHDAFALFTGRPFAAFSRVEGPKTEILIKGGVHIWFRDGTDKPTDGSNPDCAILGGMRPGMALPGCEKGARLITPSRQQEITRIAVLDFLDGTLRADRAKLTALHRLDKSIPEIEERFGD
jgi:predicted dienelactone hydrolase